MTQELWALDGLSTLGRFRGSPSSPVRPNACSHRRPMEPYSSSSPFAFNSCLPSTSINLSSRPVTFSRIHHSSISTSCLPHESKIFAFPISPFLSHAIVFPTIRLHLAPRACSYHSSSFASVWSVECRLLCRICYRFDGSDSAVSSYLLVLSPHATSTLHLSHILPLLSFSPWTCPTLVHGYDTFIIHTPLPLSLFRFFM